MSPKSVRATLALLSCTTKYIPLEALLRISLIWIFQVFQISLQNDW